MSGVSGGQERLSYIAGFFDGEGCIGIYAARPHRGTVLRAQICQNKSPESARLFWSIADEFGGRVREQLTRSGKLRLNCDISGAHACEFLKAVCPYLVLKREQAEFAVAWYEQRRKPMRDARGRILGRSDEERALDEMAVDVCRLLKSASVDDLADHFNYLLPAIYLVESEGVKRLYC